MIINNEQIPALLDASKGKIFTVTFLKNDGTVRELNGRTGVTRYLKGGSYKGPQYNTVVYDVRKKGYRSFNNYRVLQIKALGHTFTPTTADSLIEGEI